MNETEIQSSGWSWSPVSVSGTSGPVARRPERGKVGRGSEIYACAFCKGRGLRPKGVTCPVCKGRERISIQPPVVVCAFCKGSGEDKPRMALPCTVCKGKGLVTITEPFEVCPDCRGSGKKPASNFYCSACKGKGVVEAGGVRAGHGVPSGTEKKVMKVIGELMRAGRNTLADRLKISTAYSEQLLNSLLRKRMLSKEAGGFFKFSEMGKKYMTGRL